MHWKAPFRENASFTYFAVRTCTVTLVTRDGRGGSRRISPSCQSYCGRALTCGSCVRLCRHAATHLFIHTA